MGNKELVYHIVRQLSEDSRLWNFMLKKKRKERENVNGEKIVMIHTAFLKIIPSCKQK